MNTRNEDVRNSDSNEMAPLDAGELTHAMVESYMTRGRYLQSVFVVNLLNELWRMLKAGRLRGATSMAAGYGRILRTLRVVFDSFGSRWNQGTLCKYEPRERPAGVDPARHA